MSAETSIKNEMMCMGSLYILISPNSMAHVVYWTKTDTYHSDINCYNENIIGKKKHKPYLIMIFNANAYVQYIR